MLTDGLHFVRVTDGLIISANHPTTSVRKSLHTDNIAFKYTGDPQKEKRIKAVLGYIFHNKPDVKIDLIENTPENVEKHSSMSNQQQHWVMQNPLFELFKRFGES